MIRFPSTPLALSRRSLLQLATASVAAAPISALAQSAAGPTDGPRRGGRLILASRHGSTTDSTDPALITNAYQGYVAYAFTSTLTEILPDGSVGPALAESWDTADGLTWLFNIRPGVTFHDGRGMTVEDVITSINHHRAEGSNSYVRPIANQIAAIAADGPDAVRITLHAANADFPASLSLAGFTIYPADGERMNWQGRNGTGGYVLRDYEPGVRAFLTRNPDYWRDDRAFADEVELLCIADATARVNAMVSGRVHAIDQVDLRAIPHLSRQDRVVIDEVPGPLHYSFPMRIDAGPFDNRDVRLALKHAINREEMLDKILMGHGTIGNDTPIGPSYPYFDAGLERRAYDPDRARWHLQQAGLSALRVDLQTAEAAFAGATDAAVLFAENARPAGIDINVVRVPDDGYWSNVWTRAPFCAAYWGGFAFESQMFAVGYAPGAAWNDTGWTDERFESLRLAAAAELDDARRRQMYAEMQTLLRDDGGSLIFAFANYVMARSTAVAHGPLASNNNFDGSRIAERWWLV